MMARAGPGASRAQSCRASVDLVGVRHEPVLLSRRRCLHSTMAGAVYQKERLMQLYFIRHGLADWPDWPSIDDEERPLTERGRIRFSAGVVRLRALGLAPAAILTSPLARARESAALLAEGLEGPVPIVEPLLRPGFDFDALTALVQRWHAAPHLLLVGHEPDLSTTISTLIDGGRVVMKKGGVARVDLLSLAPPNGELVWLLAPKTLVKG